MPVHEVARWPREELDLCAAYMAIEGTPDERIELAIANQSALTANLHRGKGKAARPLTDFIVNRDPWHAAPSPVDDAVGSQLDAISRKRRRKRKD